MAWRTRDGSPGGAAGSASLRGQRCDYPRHILGGGSKGCGSSEGTPRDRRGSEPRLGSPRHRLRGSCQVDGSSPKEAPRGSPLPPRLPQTPPGWARSCSAAEERNRRRRRSLDEQPGGSKSARRRRGGRRASRSPSERSHSWRCTTQRSSASARTRHSQGKFRKLRRGEEEEKEEEEKEGQGKGTGHQNIAGGVQQHVPGPPASREESFEETGAEAGQKKGAAVEWELIDLGIFLRGDGRRSGGSLVRGGGEGQARSCALPRSTHVEHHRIHAGGGRSTDGPAMGGREHKHPSDIPSVLEVGDGTPSFGAHAPRDPHIGVHTGPPSPREGGVCHRRSDAETEEPAADVDGCSLQCSTTPRSGASGSLQHEQPRRDPRSYKVGPGGEQGQGVSCEAVGAQGRLDSLQSRRWKGQGQEQGCRKRKEQGQERDRRQRQGGEQEGKVRGKNGGEFKDSVKGHVETQGFGDEAALLCGRSEVAMGRPPVDSWRLGPTRSLQLGGEDEFHPAADQGSSSSAVAPIFTRDLKGLGMAEAACLFHQGLDAILARLDDKHCKSKASGSLFPLPETYSVTSGLLSHLTEAQIDLVRMMCKSLNSYYGVRAQEPSALGLATGSAVRRLSSYAEAVSFWAEKFEGIQWAEFLGVKSVDYRGEEVQVARFFRWENIFPALPKEIGCVRLECVCELGTLDYISRFEEYLVPLAEQVYTKPPRVMVEDGAWEQVCSGLLDRGICEVMPLSEVYHLNGKPILSGMFGVSKNEFCNGWETFRLIMNLVPVNRLCRNLAGDISTLPTWSGMSTFVLEDGQVLLMSSEDIRCFFYLFEVPTSWRKFLAFAKPVPVHLNPEGSLEPHVLASRVLPMGFLNSVSIAQHVHRRIARLALRGCLPPWGPEQELRKDRALTQADRMYRIYLDNFDILQVMDANLANLVRGEVSAGALALREQYTYWGLPRHPKKSVQQEPVAEIQGAMVDGVAGRVWPKAAKILKYAELAWLVLQEGRCSQKQMQIICGGFVYCAMFRRALLGMLNSVWHFILRFENDPPVVKRQLPFAVQLELARFLCALPLAHMNLRLPVRGDITVSDASETGGGFCISKGLTPMGGHAASCATRGDLPELEDHVQVLSIGLFDGIGALRVACDLLQLPMAGHASSEVSPQARRVLDSHFPDTLALGSVEEVSSEAILELAMKFSNAGVVLVGAGPPCQGVSGLNSDRKGALKDARSSLFPHVRRVYEECQRRFPWAQVHYFMESVASMDERDRVAMSMSIGTTPWMVDSLSVSLCRRPRLYWLSWEVVEGPGLVIQQHQSSGWESYGILSLTGTFCAKDYLVSGWSMCTAGTFPRFTTSRPRTAPGNRPAGIWQCQEHELARWKADEHRYPPYVYRDQFCLTRQGNEHRLPSVAEKEVIMGFPLHYTASCSPKGQQQGSGYSDIRSTLLGNSWHVVVVAALLRTLFHPLGLTPVTSIQSILDQAKPGGAKHLASFLQRLPLQQERKSVDHIHEVDLAKKLVGFVSIKGEDLLLQAASENQVKFHRLRSSVPARLWRWRTVSGWKWKFPGFHINGLELQAVLTSIKWRLTRKRHHGCRFIHLTDSLVALHSLSRGRSSSRRLRPIISKINALMLASDVHIVWGYVSTRQNPADRPSRGRVKRTCQKGKRI